MSHCRARQSVIAALDAAISCRGIFRSGPKMTFFELIGHPLKIYVIFLENQLKKFALLKKCPYNRFHSIKSDIKKIKFDTNESKLILAFDIALQV